jgi:hypothetical protein
MGTNSIGVPRSTKPGTTVRVDPARLTWGSAETFQLCAGGDLETARYWSSRVFRPAHNIAHPAVMADCPGCRYETTVAR